MTPEEWAKRLCETMNSLGRAAFTRDPFNGDGWVELSGPATECIRAAAAQAHAEGRAEALEEAARNCEQAATRVKGAAINIGLRAQAIAIRALAGQPSGDAK